jgi:predicted small lipoprotein YifL
MIVRRTLTATVSVVVLALAALACSDTTGPTYPPPSAPNVPAVAEPDSLLDDRADDKPYDSTQR